ncbi:MAG: hypothetical protein ACOYM2_14795 [Rectinemataceae bacterium]
MLHRRLLVLGFLALAMASQLAWSLEMAVAVSGKGGATIEGNRPLLARGEGSVDTSLSLGTGHWIFPEFSLSLFAATPSTLDPSLYLYRGYQGLSLSVLTGPRFFPSPALSIDTLFGIGLATTVDSGTTLVGITPLLRAEARISTAISPNVWLRIGLPLEAQRQGSALSGYAGLAVALAYKLDVPKGEAK